MSGRSQPCRFFLPWMITGMENSIRSPLCVFGFLPRWVGVKGRRRRADRGAQGAADPGTCLSMLSAVVESPGRPAAVAGGSMCGSGE